MTNKNIQDQRTQVSKMLSGIDWEVTNNPNPDYRQLIIGQTNLINQLLDQIDNLSASYNECQILLSGIQTLVNQGDDLFMRAHEHIIERDKIIEAMLTPSKN